MSDGSTATGGSTVSGNTAASGTAGSSTAGASTTGAGSTTGAASTAAASTTVAATTTAGGSGCDDDTWTKEGDKCYKIFSEESLDYFASKAACQSLGTGADLAAPKTEEIQTVLNTLWTNLGNDDADTWLGLDDCGSTTSPCDDSADGTFTFSDGTVLGITSGTFADQDVVWDSYDDFKDGQPVADEAKRQKQDCIKIDKTLNWDDSNCANTMTYACEKPAA